MSELREWTAEKLLNKALNCISDDKKHIISLARKNNHSNYKRCMAMARWCEAELLAYPSFGTESPKEKWWQKWRKRWLELAEKFKGETNK